MLLVRNLETSQRFVAPRLSSESAQTAEGNHGAGTPNVVPGGVVFDILSGYNPLPEKVVSTTKTAKVDTAGPSAARPGKVRAGRANGGTR